MPIPATQRLEMAQWQLEHMVEENHLLKKYVQDNVILFSLMQDSLVERGLLVEANGCRLLGRQGQDLLDKVNERQAAT